MGEVIRFPEPPAQPATTEPLWRELAGEQLRTERLDRELRLVDVAERAGVSPQYLSEVERGLKDPSSEMLGAITQAVGLTIGELSLRVARSTVRGPVCLAA
jgi:transcriptional regulator with XRE-family HTH domain